MTLHPHRILPLVASLGVWSVAPASAHAQLRLRPPLSTPLNLRRIAQNSPPAPAAAMPLGPGEAPLRGPSADDLQRAADASRYRLARVIVAPLVGWASGSLLALLAGVGATAVMCTPSNTYEVCVGSVVVGAYAGFLLGTPLGITFAGRWMHGLGNYSGAFLGTLFGVAMAIPVALIVRNELVTYSIGIIPAVGGMIVSELQSSARARALTAPVVAPMASPLFRDGQFTGVALGVTVRGL